jgi:hypothetical protein
MEKASIALLAAVSLAVFGCHKHKDDESVARMTEFKNRMCACKDKACSDQVSNELSRWSQAQAKSDGDKAESPSEEDPRLEAVTDEMTRCMLRLEIPGSNAQGGSSAAGSAGGAATGSAGGAATGSAGGAATGSAGGPAAGSASGAAPASPAH